MRYRDTVRWLAAAALLLALGAGCESSSGQPADAGTDGPGTSDSTLPSAWTFTAAYDGQTTPAVALKADAADKGQVWLEVWARGVSSLQGVAFRLSFEPQQLQVLKGEAAPVWSEGSAKLASKFAARPEGELWAGVGHVGSRGVAATEMTLVARVQLQLKGSTPIKIDFRAHHNILLDPKGQAVKAEWFGGEFKPVTK